MLNMTDHTLSLDDLMEHLCIVVDEPSEWPSMSIEYSLRWPPPEPDVGISSKQPEIIKIAYTLDGERFTDPHTFAKAVHARIGAEISEDVDELACTISNRIDNDLADISDEED
jgi:hypothetical protein